VSAQHEHNNLRYRVQKTETSFLAVEARNAQKPFSTVYWFMSYRNFNTGTRTPNLPRSENLCVFLCVSGVCAVCVVCACVRVCVFCVWRRGWFKVCFREHSCVMAMVAYSWSAEVHSILYKYPYLLT
jgi:hypothetical protein